MFVMLMILLFLAKTKIIFLELTPKIADFFGRRFKIIITSK